MKLLKNILFNLPIETIIGSTNFSITNIVFNSNSCIKNSLFIAIKGYSKDGHKFIDSAISSGALAIICEEFPLEKHPNVTYVKVTDSRAALAITSSNFFDNPSNKIKVVGITGTNGKTTITTLLYNLFQSLHIKCGLISTIENRICDKIVLSDSTTPDAFKINELLNEMVLSDCKICFMEVSSHGIKQKRILGIRFFGGVFTNISRDHLDYHKDLDDYILTKKLFFDSLGEGAVAIVNKDDAFGEKMLFDCKAKKVFYGLYSKGLNHKAVVLENKLTGLLLEIDGQNVKTKIPGIFNAYNLLAIYALAIQIEKEKKNVIKSLIRLESVLGRFNIIKSNTGINTIIDYAHSPGAIKTIFQSIVSIKNAHQKVITVVGCGGNRDIGKRPMMGAISYENSDITIFTSDNPRDEGIDEIIEQMSVSIQEKIEKKLIKIGDRKKAIKTAIDLANTNDIVLILGKGHEKYQEIKGKKLPFDDYEVLTKILKPL